MGMIESFEQMLANGQDNALLRFGLGNAYLQAGNSRRAIEHLRAAVRHDPAYSAAWKILGKALTQADQIEDAVKAYEEGIRVAQGKGDIQAAKEMKVFLKRLRQISLHRVP
jgi:Tfp pilus assembly protein PilF